MRKKEYREVLRVLTTANQQLEEAKALNHDLSAKLAEANLSLSVSRKVRDDVIASPGSLGETK